MNHSNTPRLADYLGHILQAIGRIKEYVQGMDEVAFSEDYRTQDAVIRNFEIIGEACRNIEKRYPEFAHAHADVPWAIAYEMRNVLAHGYFTVDLNVVWRTINNDLPGLEEKLTELQDKVSRQ